MNRNLQSGDSSTLKKILLSGLALILTISSSSLYAQITVSIKNQPLSQAFRTIERQSEYRFFYNSHLPNLDTRVSLEADDQSIEAVMSSLLKNTELTYEVKANKQIYLTRSHDEGSEQAGLVSGVVCDNNQTPMAGVTVYIVGSNTGTTTDANGAYQLAAAQGETLRFSYLGYLPVEIKVGVATQYDIVLKEDMQKLDEVVIVGYGYVKKSDLTGAVANISADESNKGGVSTSVTQMLQGRVAGVVSMQGSPQPGGGADIIIRGRNSIYGSSAPLYIVDGFPYNPVGSPSSGENFSNNGRDPLNFINPNDIESVAVLKDASATAIYGTRGANGVIIITTKRGNSGRLKVNYDGYAGVQTQAKKYELLNGPEYMEYWNQQEAGPKFTAEEVANARTTDWMDQVTQTGFVQSHMVNLSSAQNNLSYYFSAGYFDQTGIVKSSEMRRYTARSNIEYTKGKWSISTNMSFANIRDMNQADNGSSRNSILDAAISFAPYLEPSKDGSYVIDPGSSFKVYPNSLLDISDITKSDRIDLNAKIEYEIIKGLKPQIKIGYNVQNGVRNFYLPSTTPVNGGRPDTEGKFHEGKASITSSRDTGFTFEGLLNYNRTFWEHLNVVALAGYSYMKTEWSGTRAKGEDFTPEDIFGSNNMGSAKTQKTESWKGDNIIISGFGRLDLSWKDRYFLTGTVRRDGASNFGESNKWGWFPGISAAWKISNEEFLSGVPQINLLKLRVGWGVTGNSGFGSYLSQSTYNVSKTDGAIIGQDLITAIKLNATLANPDLKWEKTSQFNVGVDLAIYDRVNINFDFYKKKTSDLIIPMKLPMESGLNEQWVNAADFDVTGVELTVNAQVIHRNNFNWNVDFNFGWNDNKVSKINIAGESAKSSLASIGIIEGEKPRSYYVYKFKEINEAGAMTFYDLNNDNMVDNKDRMVMGAQDPTYTLGLGSSFSYKGFSFDFFFDSALGRKLLNSNKAEHTSAYTADPSNLYKCVLTEKNLPKTYNQTVGGDFINNSRWIEDASYLRLQNVTLSYTFGTKAFGNVIKSLRVYVQGQNLFTVSQWSGVNPESNNLYPSLRSFTGGLSITF